MKKIILIPWAVLAVALLVFFFANNPILSNKVDFKLQEVSIANLNGDSIVFNRKNYPHKLILNFYGTECGLCLTEINDIVSFSRKNDVDVLFITADSVFAIQDFIYELRRQKITDEHISFARISLNDAKRLFGDLTVPQTLLLNDNFQIIAGKKGTISYSLLKKSFEQALSSN